MAFLLSPSVIVTEKDLTSIIPAVSTSAGAFAGVFAWGPLLEPITITSESNLVERFGLPNDENFTSFFSAANFLAYSNNLLTVRTKTSGLLSACTIPGITPTLLIENRDDYDTNHSAGVATFGEFAAKYPGSLGNGIQVHMADSATFTGWAYAGLFGVAPGTSSDASLVGGSNDEIHVVIVDGKGSFSGNIGEILETYSFLSKSKDSFSSDGTSSYYKNVLNDRSKYVWWLAHPTAGTNWGGALSVLYTSLVTPVNQTMLGGVDDYTATDGETQTAFTLFANDEEYDVSLIVAGKASPTIAQYLVQNIAEVRKDCVVFISAEQVVTGAPIIGTGSDVVAKLIAYRTALNVSSSYGFLDSGWKYQYDKYNDVHRYVPLNGDIAGLAARTDYTDDPWFSFAGFNRGQIKNVVKLAAILGKTERDALFQKGINPVVGFKGQGVVLLGDKTLLAKPSAFDAINVRRLFIVLEKAIATAAKFQLFEFNDSFTRAQFKNLVEPFLRDVQGRRGITDFRVKCDEINNTGEVIDRNEFQADIFIKPARAIRNVRLNFVAARTSASFTEIGA